MTAAGGAGNVLSMTTTTGTTTPPAAAPAARRRLALGAAALIAGLGLTAAAAPGPAAAHAPAPGALDRTAADVLASGATGFMARVDDGHRVSGVAAGLADRATGRRLDLADQFEIGSNTKTFTATLVLQLVAEHRVSLSAPIERYLPGVVPNGRNITVRMLLQHTSGLFSYTSDEAWFTQLREHPERVWTERELLAVAFRHKPDFAPGQGWNYSNTNYVVAGLMLRKITGHTLGELVEQRIARPLGLHRTYVADPTARRTGPGYAHGYVVSFAGSEPTYTDVSGWALGGWAGAAGAVISTPAELSRFFSALLAGRLLPRAELAAMKQTVPLPADYPIKGGYGLGLMREDSACGPVWRHGGDTLGHHSSAFVTADGSRTAVADTTSEPSDLDGLNDGAQKFVDAADRAELAEICTMLGKPVPAP
jgi:D-alanyl-D-alanine carboxypeptidase